MNNCLATILHRLLVFTCGASLLGCGETASRNAVPVFRDSAGIRIVESGAPLWDDDNAWRVGNTPLVSIGELEGDEAYELAQVRNALRLKDGGIVIANGGTVELRFYDSGGRFVTSAGGEGGGPGEFSGGFDMALWNWPGDSVAVWDFPARRLTVFESSGVLARQFTLRTSERFFPQIVGFLRNGRLVSYEFEFGTPGSMGSMKRDTFQYTSYSFDEGEAVEIARLPGGLRYAARWSGRETLFSVPYTVGPSTVIANDQFYYTGGVEHEILVLDPTGPLRRIIRQSLQAEDLTEHDKTAMIAGSMENAPTEPAGRQAWQQFWDDVPWPDKMPTYRQLKVDAGGAVWARTYNHFGDDVPKWTVFDPDGKWLGTVALPERFDLYEVGDDYILGRWRDDLDVEYVQLYKLIKPKP